MKVTNKNRLVHVHARLFVVDVDELKAIADAEGSKWQIELRQLVRRALRGRPLRGSGGDHLIIKERP